MYILEFCCAPFRFFCTDFRFFGRPTRTPDSAAPIKNIFSGLATGMRCSHCGADDATVAHPLACLAHEAGRQQLAVNSWLGQWQLAAGQCSAAQTAGHKLWSQAAAPAAAEPACPQSPARACCCRPAARGCLSAAAAHLWSRVIKTLLFLL